MNVKIDLKDYIPQLFKRKKQQQLAFRIIQNGSFPDNRDIEELVHVTKLNENIVRDTVSTLFKHKIISLNSKLVNSSVDFPLQNSDPQIIVEERKVYEPDQIINPAQVNPFSLDDMSKEQLVNFYMNNPEGFKQLLSGSIDEGIKATASTIRKVILEITNYTASCYEKAHDQGFDGTLSDFINECVYDYFAKRNLELTWRHITPNTSYSRFR